MSEKVVPFDRRNSCSDAEWQARIDLAACYRLVALYGWDDLIFTHISARVPGSHDHFLVNRYGLMFEEMTASNLVKVGLDGTVIDDDPNAINPAGFTIHSAVHEARPDAGCVIHLHTNAGVAVSAQEEGLLPISQTALFPLAQISYHDYEGVALNPDEKQRLVADLGHGKVMILRNHGTLAIGATVADAFLNIYSLERACAMQIMAQAGGGKLRHVSKPIVDGIMAQAKEVTRGLGGALAWPALLRKLDRIDPSYRT
ncbi:MAG TPA: class II aldolase/adducin family protein [Ferrovibrio sp.]|jgi:ribulose-5-phosphate 4-epimerase/fuculose-1-phosphate aldolase|uniref:class II aldolase/adducin family protein n=1 Tax=Ferrovibrio sp. TaxID=1917215 RepID=UPI002ED1E612